MLPYHVYQGRKYYGPALDYSKTPQEHWTSEEQRPIYSSSYATRNMMKFGVGAAAIGAAGYIPIGKGQHVWDKYLGALRTMEEYSPGGIFRTFQLSTIFSPFSSAVRHGSFFINPQTLKDNDLYREYLTKLIGERPGAKTWERLTTEGATLRGGRLYWGQGQDIALKYASAYMPTGATEEIGRRAYIGAGYARALGVKPGGVPFEEYFSKAHIDGSTLQVIGGHSRLQHTYRQFAGIATEQVERFNRLLDSPFEMEPFASIFSGVRRNLRNLTGYSLKFGVEKTGGLRMLGKLGTKYGLGLGAAILGYQTLDHYTGISEGIGGIGVGANMAASRLAEATGLHAYREKQEELAPGSTSIQKLLAFPISGALGAGFGAYLYKAGTMARHQASGIDLVTAREMVEKSFSNWETSDLMVQIGGAIARKSGLYSRQDTLGRFLRRIATPDKEGMLRYGILGKMTPIKLASVAGAAVGIAAVLPFIPGALIPGTRPDELERIYTGKQEVPIRKGRWWEFGRSPYEGGRVMYFRPHWYPRMQQNARNKSIYGEDMSPIERFFKREFTYELESKHYRDRPYPVTALPFEDVPLIGPVLANTIGRFIKPPVLMHEEEWKRGKQTKVEQQGFGYRVATERGDSPGGVPVSPYRTDQVAGEQAYRLTEMIGLPGFMLTSLKEKLTGRQDFFDQSQQLESSRRMFGAERAYWDLEIGGGLGTTEALRRLYPHRRRQIEQYNPIKNTMPDWLPGPGDRSPDFMHGDPYTKVPEGEMRLPGEGYAARFPELEGVAPEDYPLIHRYKILADVAPYSDKFDAISAQLRSYRSTKMWTPEDENVYDTVQAQLKIRRQNKQFSQYQILSPMGEMGKGTRAESSELIAAINRRNAKQEPGLIKKVVGGYWEGLSHGAETPFDQLTPLAPGAKLVHKRTAIESYERDQLYGTESAFWQKPVENFLKPFGRLVARSFGWKGVPDQIEERRELEEYFDILKYVKNSRLANIARVAGDTEAVEEFENNKNETLFGLNPFTRNYSSIMRALPRRDRDYFLEFEKAETIEERQRIMEMVPENERALYLARWKILSNDQIIKAKKQGYLSDKQLEQADQEIRKFYDEANTEGFPTDKDLMGEYWGNKTKGENYADWYRRTKILPSVPLPGADWVGFHPSVDLEDIKLKVIQTIGEDMHDYDLWPSRQAQLPYKNLDDEAIAPILKPEKLSNDQIRSRINQIMVTNKLKGSIFYSTRRGRDNNDIDVRVEQDRSNEAMNVLSRALNG